MLRSPINGRDKEWIIPGDAEVRAGSIPALNAAGELPFDQWYFYTDLSCFIPHLFFNANPAYDSVALTFWDHNVVAPAQLGTRAFDRRYHANLRRITLCRRDDWSHALAVQLRAAQHKGYKDDDQNLPWPSLCNGELPEPVEDEPGR